MGIFSRRIDIKKGTKVTYSEDDIRKLEMNFNREFRSQEGPVIYTPFRKEPPRAYLTQLREMVFESVLDKHLYTFKHLLVVPNPYGVSVQTALILFNTSKECRVRYRVRGNTPETDFVGETGMNTRHRVPIMGLYTGRTNKLVLELLDEEGEVIRRRDLTIYARELPLKMRQLVSRVVHQEASQFPFLLVNGLRFNPIVLDQDGEVRYALQLKTNKIGMIPLQNGHFLYPDISASRAGEDGAPMTCQYHEMDYMGRIYRTFYLEYPIRRAVAQDGDSLFLVTASSSEYSGDRILQVDMNSGKVRKQCDLVDILGDRYRDRRGWVPVTHMEYRDGKLLLTLKRFHTILLLGWEDLSVQWILAPEQIWKDTPLAPYVLRQEGEIGLLPEYAAFQEGTEERLLVYNIQDPGSIPVEGEAGSPKSRAALYEIDAGKGTCRVLEQVRTAKAAHFGKAIPGEGRILAASGLLQERTEKRRGVIVEADLAAGKAINRFILRRGFGNVWEFTPDISSYGTPLDRKENVILGQLEPPERFCGELPPLSEEKLKKRYFGKIHLCGSLLLFRFYPGMIQRVYLVGEKNSYVQDYSGLLPRQVRRSFGIALGQLACDEYRIFVEYDGSVYQLKNEVRIETQKDKQR